MKKELDPKYDHLKVEQEHYKTWIDKGYFTAGDKSKDPFCIVIPPPNVTGKLHLGHAWDTTLQDIVARYKRMQGYDMLWLPGMDHAGIATQAKVDERLKNEGISRYDIGREKFLDRAWEWKEEYASTIRKQWAKMGLSLDYTRERFTLDEGLSEAVRKVFVDLYNDGLIYQGERIINWDPQAKTALSNIEVIHKEIEGAMYYFNYKVVETGANLVIATTRPETMFADQAIFVHPEDERYKDIVGMHVINPANGEELPIMADDYIDMSFGTAVMKCTPAHDPNDFALAKKYGLKMPICMNPDGTMNEMAHKYAGMDRFACRKALVEDFEKAGVVDHIEKHMHQVGHSERTGVIVEPYLSKQWFVKMKPLAEDVLKNQEDENQKIHFYPVRFEKTFHQWLENIEDWCISRQLWWGHRIPAWYHKETGEIYVGMEDPKDIENWTQDEDVLDTWFSSALWPFSTLGWPNETDDLNRYFPNDLLVTGYDIIFFWVARMAFQTRYCMHNRPFKDVLIHGLVRDSQGRKMSKSLGNGIDPMDVIEKYGVDALRFFLTTNSTPGQDLRFIDTKVEASWNFINKIWNASRFTMMQVGDMTLEEVDLSNVNIIDKWILTRFNEVLENVTNNMDKYEFALVGNELYSFIWDDFCSWYIELSKAGLQSDDAQAVTAAKSTLITVLSGIIRMLEPFMPFVSEEIYLSMPHAYESINKEAWPEKAEITMSEEEMASVKQLITMIEAVRAIKVDYNLKPSMDINVMIKDEKETLMKPDAKINAILQKMCHASWTAQESSEEMVTRPILNGTLSVPLASIINVEEEIEKLSKELKRLTGEIKRGEGMLSNPNFVNKAPEAKVNAEKEKLEGYRSQYAIVEKQLEEMKKKA
ncbi:MULTISPECIES: valine--tRNA ligase [Bacillota]|uniref:Valine--tRNA ligase n=2 Tax=Amedibacillus TaxID=2749846 RepID=A0A7G9GL07_9FIRM|nr:MULTISPECIES: valine--tRNA ligase [Bacillota]QNM11489.1 valine--tRNA ligase [[Eubacterium] hominis]MCH4284495.1 valine--tRNA ligase [Amedibacillus hominis]RGB54665.1 valine--tRNA ligase [Absiella sp. AM22-9]RGB56299.1 valine--tRNA ligase [Absiella sp. AM10-20]RGB65797.1 valine--tRNA ligase [Absiella sp. AM09-45]